MRHEGIRLPRSTSLPLDGMRETHDWFRKPGQLLTVTLEKIACINRAGIRSVVMTTVSGANIERECPDIIDAVASAWAQMCIAFARYCPTSERKGRRH